MNPVKYGLWEVTMCQHSLIKTNVPVVQDADSGGRCACAGGGRVGKLRAFSAQLCCELRTALKSKVY